MKILFTGGGTGGHLMPVIAVARELRRLYAKNDLDFYYLGPKDQYNSILLSQENFKVKTIAQGKIRRYFSLQNITDIFLKIPLSFFQSFFLILFIRPKIIFSKGGPGSLVVCFSGRILGIPVFLHESDSFPGLSNRIASRWAKKIFISFPKTEYFDLQKAMLVGNPIRKELLEGNKEEAGEFLNLTLEKPVILFLGGSQGAEAINNFVLSALNDILIDYEIIHVAGSKNYKSVKMESQLFLEKNLERYYHLYEYLNEVELKHAYGASDLMISRAGAGSIFEIAAAGKPSILIPLPSSAKDHQNQNAYQYAATRAAIIIEQNNLTPNLVIEKINFLLSNQEKLDEMKKAALEFARPLAAKAMAREILEYLNATQKNKKK